MAKINALDSIELPLTSLTAIVGSVVHVALLLVTTSVVFDFLNLLADNIQIGVNPGSGLIQLHEEIQRANLELPLFDLWKEIEIRKGK